MLVAGVVLGRTPDGQVGHCLPQKDSLSDWDTDDLTHAEIVAAPGSPVRIGPRRHAVVEQSIAELKSAGWAHAPSGRFFANAAWTSLAVMAHNLARAIGALSGPELARATVATLRRKLFGVPGRLVRFARRLRLRLPRGWPWQTAFLTALDAITALPMRC